MRTYMRDFLKNEEGVEAMEWLAIVTVAAALIAIAAAFGDKIKAKLSNAASHI